MDPLFVIYLSDCSLPAICDGDKLYIGTKEHLLNYYLSARQANVSIDKLNGLFYFINEEKHNKISGFLNKHKLGETCTVLNEKHLTTKALSWTHVNVWGFDYYMKAEQCNLEIVWIRHHRKYYRCIKPDFLHLSYSAAKNTRHLPLKMFWGQPGFFTIEDGWTKSNLYVIEKTFKNKDELSEDFEKFHISSVNYSSIINEIFGDG